MSVQSWLESGDPLGDRFWLSPKKGKRMEVSDSLDWSHRRGVVIFLSFILFLQATVFISFTICSLRNRIWIWQNCDSSCAIALQSSWLPNGARRLSLSLSLSLAKPRSLSAVSARANARLSRRKEQERENTRAGSDFLSGSNCWNLFTAQSVMVLTSCLWNLPSRSDFTYVHVKMERGGKIFGFRAIFRRKDCKCGIMALNSRRVEDFRLCWLSAFTLTPSRWAAVQL